MRVLHPTFEIWPQQAGEDGIYLQIERAGRVCYKSEKNQTVDSARPFCQRMLQNQHYAMLEHGTVYLQIPAAEPVAAWYRANKFSHTHVREGVAYVTTNLRVLAENHHLNDLQRWRVEPTPQHERRVTVHFTTQIAITREFNRHRVDSIAEQSTRYCNYSKDKFGNEIAINLPTWVGNEGFKEEDLGDVDFASLFQRVNSGEASALDNWLFANLAAERAYLNLIALGKKPQEARVVLPLDANTELVHTAFVSDWLHFFDLRALDKTGPAHPDAKILAVPLYNKMKEMGFIK
ncbi:MAG: FAD-dependent thymidylate synthase [Prevotella sp.]|jgi:thymidylate synthase (FAD)